MRFNVKFMLSKKKAEPENRFEVVELGKLTQKTHQRLYDEIRNVLLEKYPKTTIKILKANPASTATIETL